MPLLHAYIDESGDDGMAEHCPPWLVLSALIINESDIPATKKDLLAGLHTIWGEFRAIPSQVHFRKEGHERKKALLQLLGKFNYTAICIAANKPRFTPDQKQRLTCPKLYHYLAKHLVERLSWLARETNQEIVLHFSSRKQIHFGKLHEYLFTILRNGRTPSHGIDYRYINGCGELAANTNHLCQAADWIASGVAFGLNADKYGNTEHEYCRIIWGKFWVRRGNLWSYGFKCLPTNCDHKADGLIKKIGTWLEVPTTLV